MTSPWREVTAWPFVVPVAALAGAVLLWRLHRRAALTLPRVLVGAVVAVYVAGVVANSLFPVFIGKPGSLSWWEVPNLVPVVGSFMEPRILGGRTGTFYGTVIEDQFVAVFNWPLGAALSFILLGVVLVILAAASPIIRRAQ